MKQVTLQIPDNKYAFFLELINNLDFVNKVDSNVAEEQVLNGLKQAVKEVNLIKEGKLQARSLQEVLDEL